MRCQRSTECHSRSRCTVHAKAPSQDAPHASPGSVASESDNACHGACIISPRRLRQSARGSAQCREPEGAVEDGRIRPRFGRADGPRTRSSGPDRGRHRRKDRGLGPGIEGARCRHKAVRIDARGRYLLPALSDMHVHVEGELWNALLSPEAKAASKTRSVRRLPVSLCRQRGDDGAGAVRDPELLPVRGKIAAGEMLAPRLILAQDDRRTRQGLAAAAQHLGLDGRRGAQRHPSGQGRRLRQDEGLLVSDQGDVRRGHRDGQRAAHGCDRAHPLRAVSRICGRRRAEDDCPHRRGREACARRLFDRTDLLLRRQDRRRRRVADADTRHDAAHPRRILQSGRALFQPRIRLFRPPDAARHLVVHLEHEPERSRRNTKSGCATISRSSRGRSPRSSTTRAAS